MSQRNICFSCHAYIGDWILMIMMEVEKVGGKEAKTPIVDIMDIKEASYVGNWMDKHGIHKNCCRDAVRDAANVTDKVRETNLIRL